jgi:DNA recombination protein RmuC
VWELLGIIKTEFGKFGGVLAKTKKKLQEASNTIETAERKTRTIERKLRKVEGVPVSDPIKLVENNSEEVD